MNLRGYLAKMRGGGEGPPPVRPAEVGWSWLGSAVGIGLCGYVSARCCEPRDVSLMLGSFGASAVLIYGAVRSPLAQPRNLIGGHVLSALVGVASYHWLGGTLWLAAALAVSTAIAVMLLTRTLHPPGGATALIAVIGGTKIHVLGFLYPLFPVGVGALLLLLVAVVVNNIAAERTYPEYWL